MSTSATPSVADLNARYALGAELTFREGAQGLIFVDVNNATAGALLCLQGAHLVTWRPHAQEQPVIWVSEAAQFAPRKSIRGGVPVCWPWFGPHPAGGTLPSHGFARTFDWQVAATRRLDQGATEICFVMRDHEQTRALWPHAFTVQLRVTVGAQLQVELGTTNDGDAPFALGEALHTYFRVGDIGDARVQGLDGLVFVDNARGASRGRQQGDVRFSAETDRVYLDTPSDLAIVDPVLGRRILISQSGARSAIVWNPWLDKATKMGDLGAGARHQGGWREMVCVESGNALENAVEVAPGATHRMAALYRAESI